MNKGTLQQFKLDGRVALITGGNKGLGLAMAKAVAEAGADICIAARNADDNRRAESEITEGSGIRCSSYSCDVTDESEVKSMVRHFADLFGRIDILVNSAGINIRGKIDHLSFDEFRKVQEVNVNGTWLTSREVIPIMRRHRYGRIINIGSMLSVIALPERTPYASSKGAVLQMTRVMALETSKDGINVNAILPGPFATEMNKTLINDPEKYQAFISRIPLGRWAEPDEIGGLTLFLASPASSFVTGAAFTIDGGWTAQ